MPSVCADDVVPTRRWHWHERGRRWPERPGATVAGKALCRDVSATRTAALEAELHYERFRPS